MSKKQKLITKFLTASTFKWSELTTMLKLLGYREIQGDGSRIKFDNGDPAQLLNLHKPHPGNEMKAYAVRQVRDKLKNGGLI